MRGLKSGVAIGLAAAFAVGLLIAPQGQIPTARAGEAFIPTTDRGAYVGPSEGTHDPANENFRTGGGDSGGLLRVNRAFFYFAVPPQSEQLASVELQLFNPPAGYHSSDATETLSIFDVSTPAATVRAGGNGKTTIWNDLGSGTQYGSVSVKQSDDNKIVSIVMDAAFVAKVQAGGDIIIGAALTSFDSDNATEESAFNATNIASAATLKLTTGDVQPDGQIRVGTSGLYMGNDTYNSDGSGQTATGAAKPGKTVLFNLLIQNDSGKPDRIAVLGNGSTSQFKVSYFKGSNNITAKVTGDTSIYKTKVLAPGASVVIKIKVKVLAGAPAGSQNITQITLRSEANFSHLDVIKAVVNRS